jgi:hypothetical protein
MFVKNANDKATNRYKKRAAIIATPFFVLRSFQHRQQAYIGHIAPLWTSGYIVQMRSAMKIYTVRLRDGTVGQITSINAPNTGYEMTITVHDAHGSLTKVTGVVEDVLEEKARC